MSPNILVALPINPKCNLNIANKFNTSLSRLFSKYSYTIYKDDTFFPAKKTDHTPWSKVTRIRNHMLDTMPWQDYTHVLWIDNDIVLFPPDIIDKLLEIGAGVAAPMVMIECEISRFYDKAAFIIHGRDYIEPDNIRFIPGRNLSEHPPYWSFDSFKFDIVKDMDCVGSCLLVHTDIYRSGARYQDHPAFTDHYPICKRARELGLSVKVRTDTFVYHANLPMYGEKWHSLFPNKGNNNDS